MTEIEKEYEDLRDQFEELAAGPLLNVKGLWRRVSKEAGRSITWVNDVRREEALSGPTIMNNAQLKAMIAIFIKIGPKRETYFQRCPSNTYLLMRVNSVEFPKNGSTRQN